MTFEPILKYVCLRSEAVGSERTPAAMLVFKWLREKKGVQRILEVQVAGSDEPFSSEEAIQAALTGDFGNFGIELWDWKKVDISIDTIVKAAPSAQVVTLYSSGNASVLHAWSGKHGLARLVRTVRCASLTTDRSVALT
jgi:hypothetical protein